VSTIQIAPIKHEIIAEDPKIVSKSNPGANVILPPKFEIPHPPSPPSPPSPPTIELPTEK
jgi:hypothetical protein